MAIRPVFTVSNISPYVKTVNTEFYYYSGFALSQSQKSIKSLHESFEDIHPAYAGKVLEVSSKSPVLLGVKLSAFNLQYTLSDGSTHPVESVFQSGKCFGNGKQYLDILQMTAHEAKHDPRLKSSGEVVAFRLEDKAFSTQPLTFFYDWIYINALMQHPDLIEQVMEYRAFTDIAFNPIKSFNCQARSVALFVSLKGTGLLEKALSDSESFRELIYSHEPIKEKSKKPEQLSMNIDI